MTSDEIAKVISALRKSAPQKETCPKCGREVFSGKVDKSVADYLAAIGYDGTCCWGGFP